MEEEEAATAAGAVAVRNKRKLPLAANNTDDDSDLKDQEKEIGFRSGSRYHGKTAAAVSDPPAPPPLLPTPTPTPQTDMKAATLLDKNVDEFFAILKRVHVLAKYLKKMNNNNNNAGGDLNLLRSTMMTTGPDNVSSDGAFSGDQANNKDEEADDVADFNGGHFDLNAAPQAEDEDFAGE